MLSTELLQDFAELSDELTLEDISELFAKASPRQLNAGETYISIGDRSRMLAFIEKGLIRAFAEKDNGEQATLLLRWEDQFVGSHDTIIFNQPSKFAYQAIESTTILELDYALVEKAMEENPKFESVRKSVLMSMLGGALQMLEDFVLLSPEQRYIKLVDEKMDIVNRVADKHIASMLGITPVSLSRIRKRIANRKD
ncbi:MAG: Crp/Fnr family transcriptional regulator [Flavobacterium sp.]|nr:Crp/Fnr family transcriptional regulator [Flavobacterium sp.]